MSRLFFLMLLPFVLGGIEENKSFEPFYGSYYPVYAWPKEEFGPESDLCVDPVKYSAYNYTELKPYTCECQRKNPNLALVLQKVKHYRVFSTPILADIINSTAEIEPAVVDNCKCEPYFTIVHRSVFRRIDENFFVEYDKVPSRTTYVYGKYVPNDEELQSIIDGMEETKGQEGGRACPVKSA